MKKVLTLMLALVMVIGVSVNALAATGGFVGSVSGKPGPDLVGFDRLENDCDVDVVVTPYGDKDSLADEERELLEDAYNQIKDCDNLTELNLELKEIAEKLGIDGEDLSVSDLFNLGLTDCDEHDGHKPFEITLSADALANFAGLMYMNADGEWVMVDDVVIDGNTLKFTTDYFGPYAIVVNNSDMEGTEIPKNGDNSMVQLYAVVMAVSAAAVAVLAVKSKKESN
jgi:hypothetical protein